MDEGGTSLIFPSSCTSPCHSQGRHVHLTRFRCDAWVKNRVRTCFRCEPLHHLILARFDYTHHSTLTPTTHRLSLTPHGSPVTPHGSPVTPRGSPVTPHGSPVTPHGSPLTTRHRHSPLTAQHSRLTPHHSLLTVHCSPFTTHCQNTREAFHRNVGVTIPPSLRT